MTLDRAKSIAFARQAGADLATFRYLSDSATGAVPDCHRLMFLQMACEKLCKAHNLREPSPRPDLERSHVVIGHFLTQIARRVAHRSARSPQGASRLIAEIARLARSIEALSPSADSGVRRRDNCEYPWQLDDRTIVSPLDHPFPIVHELRKPAGLFLVRRLLPESIHALLPDPK